MAYNYTNLANPTLDMIPIYSASMTANSGAVMANHPNFINQLAAAITAANSTTSPPATLPTSAPHLKRESTPEPPPAPKLSADSPKMKPHQGTAPMDLDNDSESETSPVASTSLTATASASTSASASASVAAKCTEKLPLNVHEPNMYLNGLMTAGLNAASPYMFFQATAASTTTTAPSTGSMLMDPNAMMAAMQQLQQHSFAASYTLPDAAAVDGGAPVASTGAETYPAAAPPMKEVIKTKSCILFPPNPNAPPPTIRERPPGCRTVFVGGLPENITEEIIREIFESCGEITTLRMSKKNFCHIRYRHEASIDRAIYLSGYRVRISSVSEPANFGRLHVDYAQARDDQYDYECKQRQLQREQRHRERMSLDRLRSQSPPPMPHYTDHEASLVAENLRNNETFVKAVQTITAWLERGDCTKRNANIFYSMIQSTHAHVRRLHSDKQQLEDDLRKSRDNYRKQMLTMSTQFTQIEKVFSAASHKKVWDHFTKAQRKNIDQWKKLASELRSIQIDDDEMEMSDEDRDYHSASHTKRSRYDSEGLKEENDSLRCQLEAMRNEMSLDRTDIKYNSDFREKQIKVLQETIRNMQTQLMQTKLREQKDAKVLEQLERKLKEAGVKQLLLKTKIKDIAARLKDKEVAAARQLLNEPELVNDDEDLATGDGQRDLDGDDDVLLVRDVHAAEGTPSPPPPPAHSPSLTPPPPPSPTPSPSAAAAAAAAVSSVSPQIIDIDVYKSDDDIVEIREADDDDNDVNDDTALLEKPAAGEQRATKDTDDLKGGERRVLVAKDKHFDVNKTDKQHLNDQHLIKERTCVYAEAKVIALATAYLMIHPSGVDTLRICTYLKDMMKSYEITESYLEDTLNKYRNLFKPEIRDTSCVWKFCGFD